MPEFTHKDRNMIEAEQTLWIAAECLEQIEHAGVFSTKIGNYVDDLRETAAAIRTYNDQFETEEQ